MHDRDFVSSPYPTSVMALQNRTKKFPNTTSALEVMRAKRFLKPPSLLPHYVW